MNDFNGKKLHVGDTISSRCLVDIGRHFLITGFNGGHSNYQFDSIDIESVDLSSSRMQLFAVNSVWVSSPSPKWVVRTATNISNDMKTEYEYWNGAFFIGLKKDAQCEYDEKKGWNLLDKVRGLRPDLVRETIRLVRIVKKEKPSLMASYSIPVSWTMISVIHVDATSLEEAKNKIYNDSGSLPIGEYLEGSFSIEEDDRS